jgi:hydroxymethylpyrimidine/phosphomethylpyrimidine kinase
MTPPVALTIAGSDSGGGAGIQADLRTFGALRVHGCTAVAALTAQNTTEVRSVQATPPELLREQIDAVLDDLPVAAVKTGMLATAANVLVVAAQAAAGRLPHLVVDPVLVSSTGHRLLDPEAEGIYLDALFPHAVVITPNSREAGVLLGSTVRDFDDQVDAAHQLAERSGARWVVVKGGDLTEQTDAVDVVVGRGEVIELTAERVRTRNNHGTGCSFAAAIAANLARGAHAPVAIEEAKQFVTRAVRTAAAWELGAGHGPIDHHGWDSPEVGSDHPQREEVR